MADVLNVTVDSLDRRRDRKEKSTDDPPSSSPPPPSHPPPQPSRRRDRDSRERRDDRDLDRPPNRRGGDYYDRNRSSPPPPPREREYKRRASNSPPPPLPAYRDRRHSPPSRRSPPPFKRSRRDDGGYDGHRGGFGRGDRRFGYDHPGGYDRDMGGRPYPDEKPHGRFFGRSSGGYQGHSDRDFGRGGDMSRTGNTREGLMSYKQFIQELEDDILPAEAERRYQEYKSEYISTQKHVFFQTHKDEEWLKNKYHPTNLLPVIERRNELAKKTAKEFLLDLQSGTLDLDPGVTASSKPGQTSDPNSEEEGKRRRHAREETDLSSAPKAHPISSQPRRVQLDIEQAQALVRKLDSEKGINENILSGSDTEKMSREKSGPVIIIRGVSSVKGLEGAELLDTLITYLWRIHGVDYYGSIETSEPKGYRHVRAEGKSSESDTNNGALWEKKLDSYWQERLNGQDPMEKMTAKEKIEAVAVESLEPFVRKIRDEKYGWKYGCGAKGCTKLFHASEYVQKHLKLKHPELMMESTVKLCEELYFQNYMNDPDAPGGTPVMQQPILNTHQRPKLGMESRLKDDRGNRRERDNRANDSDRFDNNQSNNDDGNHDESMFDTFGGQGMHGFPSETVLMPVPGAGPLGPFVPAPPEVAMRMFGDQGGPPAFDGGRPGPQLGGPAPMLLPPNFRQDPRRLRSYQDLDAPEDEVTVIDYRSL